MSDPTINDPTINDKGSAETKSAQTPKNGSENGAGKSNDFVVGLVTFIIFLIFMTGWMYFST